MSHKNVLKRAWEILWQYKALWVFGLVLALTTASYSPQGPPAQFQSQPHSAPVGRTNRPLPKRSFALGLFFLTISDHFLPYSNIYVNN